MVQEQLTLTCMNFINCRNQAILFSYRFQLQFTLPIDYIIGTIVGIKMYGGYLHGF